MAIWNNESHHDSWKKVTKSVLKILDHENNA